MILQNNRILLEFPYDEIVINNIKTIEGRQWHSFPNKCWSVPCNEESLLKLESFNFNIEDIRQQIIERDKLLRDEYNKLYIEVKEKYPFLFKYQIEAVAKGIINKKIYIADDMGLGKSIESTVILEYFMQKGEIKKCLILTTKKVSKQFKDNVFDIIGKEYKLITSSITKKKRYELYKEYDRIIMTHDLCANDIDGIKPEFDYGGLIIDEVTKIKNRGIKRTEAIIQLHPKIEVFCSGTPFHTKLEDIWNTASILNPDWMNKFEFYKYKEYEEHPYLMIPNMYKKSSNDPDEVPLKVFVRYKNLDKFAKRFSEIGIKRKFEEVSCEAIQKIYYVHNIDLTKEQKALIEFIINIFDGRIFGAFEIMKKVCASPDLLLETESEKLKQAMKEKRGLEEFLLGLKSPKLEDIVETIEELNDNKIVIYSSFPSMRKKY